MATRSEVDRRRTELISFLRSLGQNRGLSTRTLVPSVRELADRFGLSIKVVRQTVQSLVDDGILYTISRVGTFVGQRVPSDAGYYLFLLSSLPAGHDPDNPYHKEFPAESEQGYRAQIGFEERIARYGGASFTMINEEVTLRQSMHQMPALAGVFDFGGDSELLFNKQKDPDLPIVVVADTPHTIQDADEVSFNNVDGGFQAAKYLLGLGHKNIAYLAMHTESPKNTNYIWSAERESGWRQAMSEAGQSTAGLAFHHNHSSPQNTQDQCEAAKLGALPLTARHDITAVVTANDNAALGLFTALKEAEIPAYRWPVVVSFDNLIHASKYLLTSFNLPWEEIGRAAADLLWERKNGQLSGPPQHRLIPMRLIRRLTSQAGWSVSSLSHAQNSLDSEVTAGLAAANEQAVFP